MESVQRLWDKEDPPTGDVEDMRGLSQRSARLEAIGRFRVVENFRKKNVRFLSELGNRLFVKVERFA